MKKYLKSPFNYIGGKTKILDDLFSIFPKRINKFVEPFCGGYNVGINVDADEIYEIEINKYLIDLLSYLKSCNINEFWQKIDEIINKYRLSLTNRDGFNKLRADYNKSKQPEKLFVLICYSFNHQIRFNNSLEFNTPFGMNRSTYNENIKNNLVNFVAKMHEQKIYFINGDFESFDYSILSKNDFVYCDPPYLITTGSYNDGKRGFGDWTLNCEKRLLNLLDNLDKKGIKFA